VYFVEERRTEDIQQDLERTEDTLKRLMGNINDAVYTVDADWKEFSYVSPAFERQLGYTLDDIEQMAGQVSFLRQVVQKNAFEAQDETLDHMRRGETIDRDQIESWIRCKGGGAKCFEDHWIPEGKTAAW